MTTLSPSNALSEKPDSPGLSSAGGEFTLLPYSSERKAGWDAFVASSRNATFLHLRDYLEYHVSRFPDASLMVYRRGRLHALLPATFDGTIFSSHAGLTYGGLILGDKTTTADALRIMELIRGHASALGAGSFIYKPVPHIYHRLPAEEDLYALFRLGARIEGRQVAAVADLRQPLKMRDIRKAGIRKASAAGITVAESDDFPAFWRILSENLRERYGAAPVHSLEEMQHLKALFPDRIRLHAAFREGEMLGATVLYLTDRVAHVQYISASPEGKALHALDLLFSRLMTACGSSLPLFDFGTSNTLGGHILNESLIYQKEGFGARAIVYDTYSIPL